MSHNWSASDVGLCITSADAGNPNLEKIVGKLDSGCVRRSSLGLFRVVTDGDGPVVANSSFSESSVLRFRSSQADPQQRFHFVLASAVREAAEHCRGVWVLADDVLPRIGCIDKLLDTLNKMRVCALERFVLTGYVRRQVDCVDIHSPYAEYPTQWFHGTQCLFFPKPQALEFADFVDECGDLSITEPNGLIVNRYCRNRGIPLFHTRRALVQHLGNWRTRPHLPPHRSQTFDLPWPGPEEDAVFKDRLVQAEQFVAQLGQVPRFDLEQPRGIVICAGGAKYFPCAWVCIKMLRQVGCSLPIEIWHLGPEEMSERMRALVSDLGVNCVDALEVAKERPSRILNGWELKCYAVVNCRFQHVILLDADNVPVVDPTSLFDCSPYREHGAIFWPDIGNMPRNREIWAIAGVEYRDEPEFESGQLVVDKARCWTALQLAMHYNENSDFYYQYVYGDKETFHFAFRKVGKSYAMPSKGIEFIDGTLCQHDFEGNRLFQHRIKKWNLDGNHPTSGFWFDVDCRIYLQELRQRWSAPAPPMRSESGILIPKIIHRIWLTSGNPLPDEYVSYGETWRNHHPGWEMKLWTEQNLPEMIHSELFAKCTNFGQKSDILRYELLHRYGGIYVDTDFECLRPFDDILAGVECFVGEEDPERLNNAILGCIPGHAFVGELLRKLPDSMDEHAGKWPVDQTGPRFVTDIARGRADLTIFPARFLYPYSHRERFRKGGVFPDAYAVHHWAHSWFGLPNDAIRTDTSVARYRSEEKEEILQEYASAIIDKIYEYHRIGFDRRRIGFLGDGTIGYGAARCERFWDLDLIDEKVYLIISSDQEVTCRLSLGRNSIWHGRWVRHEKMLVELKPASIESGVAVPVASGLRVL